MQHQPKIKVRGARETYPHLLHWVVSFQYNRSENLIGDHLLVRESQTPANITSVPAYIACIMPTGMYTQEYLAKKT